MMKQKAVICEKEISQVYFEEMKNDVPSIKEYYSWIAKTLGCDFSEIVLLAVYPDFEEDDEEGWEIKSHFSPEVKINVLAQFENYYSFDKVLIIEIEGNKYIVEQTASPCFIYANPLTLEIMDEVPFLTY